MKDMTVVSYDMPYDIKVKYCVQYLSLASVRDQAIALVVK